MDSTRTLRELRSNKDEWSECRGYIPFGLRRALSRFAESGSQRPRTGAPKRWNNEVALQQNLF